MHARNILRADVGERDKTESDATHKFAVFVVQGQRAARASLPRLLEWTALLHCIRGDGLPENAPRRSHARYLKTAWLAERIGGGAKARKRC